MWCFALSFYKIIPTFEQLKGTFFSGIKKYELLLMDFYKIPNHFFESNNATNPLFHFV